MSDIRNGDRVSVFVNHLGGNVSGEVTDIYDNGAGTRTAIISVPGYGDVHQLPEYLKLHNVQLYCKHTGCPVVTLGRPRSNFACPDHLSEIFDEQPADGGAGQMGWLSGACAPYEPQTPC